MSVAGPGTYEVVYTITDAHDNHRSHTATLSAGHRLLKFELAGRPSGLNPPVWSCFGLTLAGVQVLLRVFWCPPTGNALEL